MSTLPATFSNRGRTMFGSRITTTRSTQRCGLGLLSASRRSLVAWALCGNAKAILIGACGGSKGARLSSRGTIWSRSSSHFFLKHILHRCGCLYKLQDLPFAAKASEVFVVYNEYILHTQGAPARSFSASQRVQVRLPVPRRLRAPRQRAGPAKKTARLRMPVIQSSSHLQGPILGCGSHRDTDALW